MRIPRRLRSKGRQTSGVSVMSRSNPMKAEGEKESQPPTIARSILFRFSSSEPMAMA